MTRSAVRDQKKRNQLKKVSENLYIRGGSMWLSLNGRWQRLGRLSLSAARAVRDLAKVNAAREAAGVERVSEPMSVCEVLDDYIANRTCKVAPSTLSRLKEHCGHLKQHLGEAVAQRLTQKDIVTYQNARRSEPVTIGGYRTKNGRRAANATINRETVALSAALRLARIPRTAIEEAGRLPEPRPADSARPPSTEELERILAEARRGRTMATWLPDVIVVAAGTGERVTAVANLKVHDVDFQEANVTFRAKYRKGGVTYAETRVAPLPPLVADALKARIERMKLGPNDHLFPAPRHPGEAISRGTIYKSFVSACRAAKVPKTPRVHDLRHLAMTLLAADGLGESLIAEYIGYRTTDMVKRYTHLRSQPRATRVAADTLQKAFTPFLRRS